MKHQNKHTQDDSDWQNIKESQNINQIQDKCGHGSCGIIHSDNAMVHEHTDNCCGVAHDYKKGWKKEVVIVAISLISLILSFINPFKNYSPIVRFFDFAWVAIILCGYPIYKGAIVNLLKNKRVTSSLLVSIAMTASIVMGVLDTFNIVELGIAHSEHYMFAAGEIAFLMAVGEWAEAFTTQKSQSAISRLIDINPDKANLKIGDKYTIVNVSDIQIGDIVLIRPNEIISIDGIVVKGQGSVNTSNITGESVPVDVSIGDSVYAGTTNLAHALEIKATKSFENSTLNKLIDYVKSAELNRAPIVRLADKWASYLVPSAIVFSVLVFIIAYFALGADVLAALKRAITVLVVVCPCALALATPTAIAASIGNASKKGILIKSGAALEMLAGVNAVAFDKTGTLTESNLVVDSVHTINIRQEQLLYYAASAELQSEHPIAKAIVKYADNNHTQPEYTESHQGVGVSAKVDGKSVKVVKYSEAIKDFSHLDYDINIDGNFTVVAVIINDKLQGVIYLTDKIRHDAADSISKLHSMGYQTAILTGDNYISAEYVGNKLGIDNVHAELLPHDKVSIIEKMKKSGKVAMVGDGVNDAPSLALSDVSIAMGAMGNSVAIETADISLMNNQLTSIPFLLKLSKRTLATIKINITISLLLSVLALILSLTGHLSVVGGAFVHNAGSVLVGLNASLLLLYKRKIKAKNQSKK